MKIKWLYQIFCLKKQIVTRAKMSFRKFSFEAFSSKFFFGRQIAAGAKKSHPEHFCIKNTKNTYFEEDGPPQWSVCGLLI